jgi:signal transduction histidine kinase
MTGLLARLAPAAWLRVPRPTARLRLTLLYGGLFLLSGAILLTATYLLFEQATATVTLSNGMRIAFMPVPSVPALSAARGTAQVVAQAPLPKPPLTTSQVAWLAAQSGALRAFDMHELLIRSGIALGLMAVISIALGWLVAGRVLRPVRTISSAARRIGASNLDQRLSLDGPDDEFRELAATLNGLLGRLEAAFDSQRRFVSSASHELRTPLTLDRALLERALRQPGSAGGLWRATCERLLVSSRQQDRLIDALLALARSEGGISSREPFELSAVIDTVLLSPDLETGTMRVSVRTETGPAAVSGDPRLVERLIRNLVDNAIRYNRPAGQVSIVAGTLADHAVLTVANSGPAIPAADIDRLFQPFQRLAPSRGGQRDGTGLGLSIVKAIADAHHATITATPRAHGGLRVEVSFPPPDDRDNDYDQHRSARPARARNGRPLSRLALGPGHEADPRLTAAPR